MATISKADLKSIAVLALAEYKESPDDDPDVAWVALITGRGEVQLDIEGQGWYLRWDRTHAVAEEIELDVPEENPSTIIWAAWLMQQAELYADH